MASQAKTDHKAFFSGLQDHTYRGNRFVKRQLMESLLVLGISKILNEYFLTVFTQKNMQGILESKQIFGAEESDRLTDIPITKEIIEQEIDM